MKKMLYRLVAVCALTVPLAVAARSTKLLYNRNQGEAVFLSVERQSRRLRLSRTCDSLPGARIGDMTDEIRTARILPVVHSYFPDAIRHREP